MYSQKNVLKYSNGHGNNTIDYSKLLDLQYNYIHNSGGNYLEQRKVLGNINLSMQDPNIPLSYYLFK
jgi:hypothetical protein